MSSIDVKLGNDDIILAEGTLKPLINEVICMVEVNDELDIATLRQRKTYSN